MDVQALLQSLSDCPCGRTHRIDMRAVEIGHGVKERAAEILKQNGFPTRLLVVADENTLSASEGILEILRKGGFCLREKIYPSFRVPLACYVNEIADLSYDADGILSIGSGSLNDICRRAAYLTQKEFAIFATAPSMDGFASGTSPIIVGGIKDTLPAKQPSIIMADTAILAAAPAELKAAGFGDILGKYVALVDWRVAHLLVGEYYCERIAALVRSALSRMTAMADRVGERDEETAGFIMETLILTGVAMHLAGCSRPASGAEHQISHFWGMKKLAEGKMADYHGKKVGVATLALTRVYQALAASPAPAFCEDRADLSAAIAAYGQEHTDFLTSMNCPPITADFDKAALAAAWEQIVGIIREELPPADTLCALMRQAGAATDFDEIDVDAPLAELGLRYHSFMRRKVVLTRLLYMTDADIVSLCE